MCIFTISSCDIWPTPFLFNCQDKHKSCVIFAECGQAPEILEHPAEVVVARNEPVTLNCKVSGDPEPGVEWFKDGEGVTTARDDPRSHR